MHLKLGILLWQSFMTTFPNSQFKAMVEGNPRTRPFIHFFVFVLIVVLIRPYFTLTMVASLVWVRETRVPEVNH